MARTTRAAGAVARRDEHRSLRFAQKQWGTAWPWGGCGGQTARGCYVVPLLQGDIHKKGRSCLCLSFPPGKGELNYLMQRGTER